MLLRAVRSVGRRHGSTVTKKSSTESYVAPLNLQSPTLGLALGHQRASLQLASPALCQTRYLHRRNFYGSAPAIRGLATKHATRGQHFRIAYPTIGSGKVYTPTTAHSYQKRSLSSTPAAMTATKIDGTAIAKKIREKLQAQIEATQKVNPRYKPSLKIIQGRTVCANCGGKPC